MTDTRKRSLTKTLTWRVLALLSTFVITFLFLGDFQDSLKVTIILNAVAVVMYYLHERFWDWTDWGRNE